MRAFCWSVEAQHRSAPPVHASCGQPKMQKSSELSNIARSRREAVSFEVQSPLHRPGGSTKLPKTVGQPRKHTRIPARCICMPLHLHLWHMMRETTATMQAPSRDSHIARLPEELLLQVFELLDGEATVTRWFSEKSHLWSSHNLMIAL